MPFGTAAWHPRLVALWRRGLRAGKKRENLTSAFFVVFYSNVGGRSWENADCVCADSGGGVVPWLQYGLVMVDKNPEPDVM